VSEINNNRPGFYMRYLEKLHQPVVPKPQRQMKREKRNTGVTARSGTPKQPNHCRSKRRHDAAIVVTVDVSAHDRPRSTTAGIQVSGVT
jgi:hypothetical protein